MVLPISKLGSAGYVCIMIVNLISRIKQHPMIQSIYDMAFDSIVKQDGDCEKAVNRLLHIAGYTGTSSSGKM